MNSEEAVRSMLQRIAGLETEARAILSTHETSSSRVVTLEGSYSKLGVLSLDQDQLFRESLRAVESGLFRAGHVLAWAGFADFLHEHLWDSYQADVQRERPKWSITAAEDFRDQNDFSVIETGRVVGAYSKTVMKALHGLLNKRNECAHPSDYFPDLNGSLGYLSDLLGRIEFLQKKVAP